MAGALADLQDREDDSRMEGRRKPMPLMPVEAPACLSLAGEGQTPPTPHPSRVLLAGLIMKLTQDRLTGEKKPIERTEVS